MILPGDFNPKPVFVSGMMKASSTLTNAAGHVSFYKPSNAATVFYNFGADGKLPTATIDAFLAGEIGRCAFRQEQMSNGAANYAMQASIANAPKVGALSIGGHRCGWYESECMVDNVAPTGLVYGLTTSDVTPLGIKANNMTVMQVIQLHNSVYMNQMSGAFRGCVFSMNSSGATPTSLLKIFSEHQRVGPPYDVKTGGGYTAESEGGFRAASTNAWLETSPHVMTYISGPEGTTIGQNEDLRTIAGHSSGTTPAYQLRIGHHWGSLPPTDPAYNEAMGMAEILTIVWNKALTQRQAAAHRAILYDLCQIDPRHSHSNAPLILLVTDSVWAGYKGDDLRGWDKLAMLELPSYVRWANFACPGLGILHNPASVYYADGAGRFLPGWIAQAIRQHKGRVHCVWGTPINDYYDGTVTADYVHTNGTLKLIDEIRKIDPTVTFTLCTGTRFTGEPHDTNLLNGSALIRGSAAAYNYGVVEVRNDPVMGVAGVNNIYKDGGHLGNDGCARMKTLILPRLQAWLSMV